MSLPIINQNQVTPDSSLSAGNTAININKGRTVLMFLNVVNLNAAVRYLKVYDKADASAADTPKLRFALPPNGTPFTLELGAGIKFPTACSFRVVTEQADGGTTSPGANETVVNWASLNGA